MQRTILHSKLHRATVTQAELNYVGSITIDEDLMDAVDLLAHELVHVFDIDNGARFQTYVIVGERGSGTICINGAAARLVQPGDKVIILGFASLDEDEIAAHSPRIAVLGPGNRIMQLTNEEVNDTQD